MNDFTPNDNQSAGQVAVVEKPKLDIDTAVAIKLGQVTADPNFLQLIKAASLWKQVLKTVKDVQTEAEYKNALDLFEQIKKAIEQKELMRHGVVDFPTRFARLVNDVFRPVGNDLETVKQHLSGVIQRYNAMKKKEHDKATAEAEKGSAEPVATPPDDGGVSKIQFEPEVPEAPAKTQATSSGGKVTMRESLEVKVIDPIAFLKAVVSKDKRKEDLTADMVEIKLAKIRPLCKGKRKIPGIEWERVEKPA